MSVFPDQLRGRSKAEFLLFSTVWGSALAVLLGRAWQHLFFDAPYRTLFWDQGLMGKLVKFVGFETWSDFITSPEVDGKIDTLIGIIGGFLLLTFLVVFLWNKVSKELLQWALGLATLLLIFLAFLYSKEKFYSLGQFLEYSLQFGSIACLWLLAKKSVDINKFVWLLKILVALTFICHGLYAIGYYPRPGHFVEMCMHFFGLSEAGANTFLWYAGIFDFVAAILIFIPGIFSSLGLGYCFIWGGMTAMARLLANYYGQTIGEFLFIQTPEVIFRIPHFLIPLGLLMFQLNKKRS
ncbi:MAG: hypothetical protein HKN16_02175 [Saprospiraceae bacterium]|nr:hypothetical protein [Saprospiraceae bacterium]